MNYQEYTLVNTLIHVTHQSHDTKNRTQYTILENWKVYSNFYKFSLFKQSCLKLKKKKKKKKDISVASRAITAKIELVLTSRDSGYIHTYLPYPSNSKTTFLRSNSVRSPESFAESLISTRDLDF